MEDESDGVCYYSQDFDWNELRKEVEGSSSLQAFESSDVELNNTEENRSQVIAWESFHRRHSQGLFFKERRYLLKEFPELGDSKRDLVVLEIGCGAGSSVVPILRAAKSAKVLACDVSEAALSITNRVAERVLSEEEDRDSRLRTFRCDVSTEALPTWLACPGCRGSNFKRQFTSSCCEGGVDIITLVFTLSALELAKMSSLLKECYDVIRPGGLLFFRDYGLYDMTMLRFPKDQKVSNDCYRRQDGTLSYFFSCEVVRSLFVGAGFVEVPSGGVELLLRKVAQSQDKRSHEKSLGTWKVYERRLTNPDLII